MNDPAIDGPARARVQAVMDQLNLRLSEKMPLMEPAMLWWGCPLARSDHYNKERVFAHTNHIDGVVCCCEELSFVSEPYLYGILAHEFGHLIEIAEDWKGDPEKNADKASFEILGIPIHYGSSLKVQMLTPTSILQLQEAMAGVADVV